MAGGYQVDPNELSAGAIQVQSLLDQAASIAMALQRALGGLSSAAGDPSLQGALDQANVVATGKLADLAALYQNISQSLSASASSYQAAESAVVEHANETRSQL